MPLRRSKHATAPLEVSKGIYSIGSTITVRHPVERKDWLKDCEEIKPSKTVSRKLAALSIVNNKNGKRVKISTSILKELNSPIAVRFLVSDEKQEVYILAAQANEVAHNLAGKPTPNMVYSAPLVERLTSLFELDYSSRSSHSVGTWMVTEEEGRKIICVRLEEFQEVQHGEIKEEPQEMPYEESNEEQQVVSNEEPSEER